MKSSGLKTVLSIAGGFIAWVIGSGFATGQEVMQFFSSYGILSYAVIILNLVGFILFGYLLMRVGFEHGNEDNFNHFAFFCGKKIGGIYTVLVTGTLILLIPVLLSGGGTALSEYYHIPKAVGSGVIAVLILAVYLCGFERMVSIISKLGPIIIFFSLAVGCASLFTSIGNGADISECASALRPYRTAPTWWLSGFLYLGVNFFPGSAYFTRLGRIAVSKKEIRAGAVLGGTALILSVSIMSTAILLNGRDIARCDIPVLYLAQRISGIVGTAFSAVLILGIFSSSSVMMWSVCSRFTACGKKKNTVIAVSVALFGYVVSLFSFGGLIGTVYPIIGYIGLLFLLCVILKHLNPNQILE